MKDLKNLYYRFCRYLKNIGLYSFFDDQRREMIYHFYGELDHGSTHMSGISIEKVRDYRSYQY